MPVLRAANDFELLDGADAKEILDRHHRTSCEVCSKNLTCQVKQISLVCWRWETDEICRSEVS